MRYLPVTLLAIGVATILYALLGIHDWRNIDGTMIHMGCWISYNPVLTNRLSFVTIFFGSSVRIIWDFFPCASTFSMSAPPYFA